MFVKGSQQSYCLYNVFVENTVTTCWHHTKSNQMKLFSSLVHRQQFKSKRSSCFSSLYPWNKANLRDLIAATGLVILHKLDSNHRFFSPCDLEIWWLTFKNNRAPLLCYFKLCASFESHRLIQTGVTVQKRLIWVKIDDFLAVWP